MKLSVLDGSAINPGDLSWKRLEQFGELIVHNGYTDCVDELVRRAGDADIIIGDNGDFHPGLLEACPNIKFVAIAATGYDRVDLETARRRGIVVSNVPNYSTASVSQYAFSLLLELCGHVSFYSQQVHQGLWHEHVEYCVTDYKLIELAGKTIGIIGLGRISRAVGKIATAFGMKVLAYNPSQCDEGREIAEYVELDELLSRSDVISLHCKLNADTKGIINRESIAKMKDGVIIINNSRGSLIVSADLAQALRTGKVYAAGLDVVDGEPISSDDPLLTAPRCLITPHISWMPADCRQRVIDITEDNIRAFLNGKPQNVVNCL